MNVQCFLLKPTDLHEYKLRRYEYSAQGTCPGKYRYHNADVVIGQGPEPKDDNFDRADPRWPTKCDYCEYQFIPSDNWQFNYHHLYIRSDTGEMTTWRNAPVGAILFADWLTYCQGPDGRTVMVKAPDKPDGSGDPHEWTIEGRASNCDSPCVNCGVPYVNHYAQRPDCSYKDSRPTHRCWCRHGEAPNLTVDKNGDTCGAGGGSLLTHGGWHGFLRNGILEQC